MLDTSKVLRDCCHQHSKSIIQVFSDLVIFSKTVRYGAMFFSGRQIRKNSIIGGILGPLDKKLLSCR